MLTGLWHRTVSCSNYQDSTVHLGSTRYHVLHIVSVSWAIYMRIVAVCGFILNMGRVDGNTTLFLLGSVINLIKRLHILTTKSSIVKSL